MAMVGRASREPSAVVRFEVYLVDLNPTVGAEIRKTRPCVVVSPDEMNRHISTVIVAPMTTKGRPYPSRVPCTFRGKAGQIVLDQLRTVDKARLVRRMGQLSRQTQKDVIRALAEMFAE
jgi:mRNA interferase MazF